MKAYPQWYNPKPYGMEGLRKNIKIVERWNTATIVVHKDERPKLFCVVKVQKTGSKYSYIPTLYKYKTEYEANKKIQSLNLNPSKRIGVSYTIGRISA